MIRHVEAGALDVAYEEHGDPQGWPVVLLHGFPYDVHAYDEVAKLLAAAHARVIVPFHDRLVDELLHEPPVVSADGAHALDPPRARGARAGRLRVRVAPEVVRADRPRRALPVGV